LRSRKPLSRRPADPENFGILELVLWCCGFGTEPDMSESFFVHGDSAARKSGILADGSNGAKSYLASRHHLSRCGLGGLAGWSGFLAVIVRAKDPASWPPDRAIRLVRAFATCEIMSLSSSSSILMVCRSSSLPPFAGTPATHRGMPHRIRQYELFANV
jgi:hypothetical protein